MKLRSATLHLLSLALAPSIDVVSADEGIGGGGNNATIIGGELAPDGAFPNFAHVLDGCGGVVSSKK